ncbi:MAG: translation initiation factor IF-2 [Opitutales bacterium]|nr:translation initiation factor IF-2 [Opitutales bacterium]
MSIRVSALSKELGTTNKVLIGFLAEEYPTWGISDYKTHHSKTITDLYKEEIVEKFERYLEAHPELEGKRKAKKEADAPAPEPEAKSEAPAAPVPENKPAPVPPPVPAAPKVPVPPPPVPSVKAAPLPPPVVPRPIAAPVPPPVPVAKPAPVPPPMPKPAPVPPPAAVAPKAPVPPIPAVGAPRPAPAVPPPAPKPAPAVSAPKPAPVPPPPAAVAPKAPAVPPPVPAMPKAPSVPPMPAAKTAPSAPIPPAVPGVPAAPAPATDVPRKKLSLRAPVVVRDLATALDIRPFRIISELMSMGIFASLNQDIKDEVAVKIADNHGIDLEVKHREKGAAQQAPKPEPVVQKPVDDEKDKAPRCPVVCVLGHVDHGKTTLLDYYRKSNVTAGEAGGITQHVGAYTVVHNNQRITFLDTPGHAAFSKMRERGAALTDIAVLVVAADDGFMPQTDEALKFAQKNNVQLVVAINKCDAKGANIDRVKQQMQQRGITSEDWGGTVQCEAVSALKGTNMDSLLDAILLQAEIMELKANPKCPAEGVVVEAQMEQGRGPTATVIVQRGTLKTGDAFVCAQHFCRVRAILDEYGKPMKSIAPGNPGRVLGWSGVPSAGSVFSVVKNAREAEKIAEENKYKLRKAEEAEEEEAKAAVAASKKGMSDMDLLNSLLKESSEKVFKCVLKADVDGTLEALEGTLLGIKSKLVKIEVVGGSVGPITPGDVNTASAAGATIVAFDVKQENSVPALLKRVGVKVISHDIIYMLLDMVKEAMSELLDPEYKENEVGEAEVRAIFSLGKNNNVAGSMVLDGSIRRDFNARVIRKGEVLHTGKIDTLKRFKDDVTEVKSGYECGIRVTGFDDYKEGDRIECFEILEVRPAL